MSENMNENFQNDENLNMNDIILDKNMSQKDNQLQKTLIIIAILIVLFLIVLIIMKFINRGNVDINEEFQVNDAKVLHKKEDNSSAPLKVASQNNQKITIQTSDNKKPEQEIVVKNEEKPEVNNNQAEIKSTEDNINNKGIKQQTQESIKPTEIKVEHKPEVLEEKPKEIKKVEPKPEVKKEVKKVEKEVSLQPKEAPKVTKNISNSNNAKAGTYIQVFATASSDFSLNDPNLKAINAKGYSYSLYKANINGKEYTKVLVSPQNNQNLQQTLDTMKAINKNAFIYRVK